jgi:phosphatidylglycerol:prolipoprotein diacylglycerol transferase
MRKYNPLRGEIFLSYAILYSIGRFFIEGLRTDSLYVFGELRTAQAISIVIIVASIILIIYRRKTTTVRYLDVPIADKKNTHKKKPRKKKKK